MKRLIVFAIYFLIVLKSIATDYYWAGGSGNWSDVSNHWATSSGGAAFHTQIPNSTDNIFFDANSFTAQGQIVTIDPTIVACNNMEVYWQAPVLVAQLTFVNKYTEAF